MSSVQSIERMIQIIECFTPSKSELSIKDIVAETELHKSTIFRILSTLEKHNYIKKDNDTHKYGIGINFFKIGSIAQDTFDIRKIALPYMKKLNVDTQEAISLNIIDNNQRLCIEKIDSPRTIVNFVNIGHSNPLHIGASGKCLLANWSGEKQNQYIDNLPLDENEIESLRIGLRTIREDGYFVSRNERHQGSFGISFPLFKYDSEILASITITGSNHTFEEKYIDILKTISAQINANLGFQPSINTFNI